MEEFWKQKRIIGFIYDIIALSGVVIALIMVFN
jgi:hypothetical protein